MAECNPQVLVAAARGFSGLPPRQAKIAQLVLLRTWLLALDPGADVSVNALLARGKRFAGIPQDQFRILFLQLLCNIRGT